LFAKNLPTKQGPCRIDDFVVARADPYKCVWFLFYSLSSVANQWKLAASVKKRKERDVVIGKI
jgi:hypothetical protein